MDNRQMDMHDEKMLGNKAFVPFPLLFARFIVKLRPLTRVFVLPLFDSSILIDKHFEANPLNFSFFSPHDHVFACINTRYARYFQPFDAQTGAVHHHFAGGLFFAGCPLPGVVFAARLERQFCGLGLRRTADPPTRRYLPDDHRLPRWGLRFLVLG